MFPTAPDIEQVMDETARAFVVGDDGLLVVPGLVQVAGVTIDGVDLPLEEERFFAEQPLGKEVTTVCRSVPMIELGDLPGVGPVLRRAIWSNNGVWQPGSQVVVRGTWDDEPVEEFVSSKDVDELARERAAKVVATAQAPVNAPASKRSRKRGK